MKNKNFVKTLISDREQWNRHQEAVNGPLDENLDTSKLFVHDFSKIDFSGVDFSGYDLRGVNFRGSNLHHAKFKIIKIGSKLHYTTLKGADLSEANMSWTLFNKTCLVGVRFTKTILLASRFCMVQLTNLNLSGIDLRGVVFFSCKFNNTNFLNSIFNHTTIFDHNLNKAKGLSEALVKGPSMISIGPFSFTKRKSKDNVYENIWSKNGLLTLLNEEILK